MSWNGGFESVMVDPVIMKFTLFVELENVLLCSQQSASGPFTKTI